MKPGPAHATGSTTEVACDEAALVERARNGDTAAFEALYRREVNRVHALCWRLCGGDEAAAQDLTQEAFVRAWQKLHSFRGDSRFGTWLHRLASNVALGYRRSPAWRRRRDDAEATELTLPAEHGTAAQQLELERAVATLPPRARAVVVLHDIEGYEHREVAELTGMAVGTSKAQLHRARRLLRERLGESS